MLEKNNKYPKLRYVSSFRCDGGCPFCHHEGMYSEEETDLSRIKNLAQLFWNKGLKEATITGGEPFPLKTVLTVIDILQENGFDLTLTMSGIGSTETDMQRLWKKASHVHLSMPSFSPKQYEAYTGNKFAKFESLLQKLMDSKTDVRINYTITREVADNWQAVLEYAIYKGVNLCLQDVVWCSLFSADVYEQLFVSTLELVSRIGNLPWKIEAGYAPRLVCQISGIFVEVKSSQLSRLQRYNVCDNCRFDTQCTERICAIRLYPSGRLSTCLEGPRETCWTEPIEDPNSAVNKVLSTLVR
jgi:molybdenum cofactor biosynthesis enzyme MoaA